MSRSIAAFVSTADMMLPSLIGSAGGLLRPSRRAGTLSYADAPFAESAHGSRKGEAGNRNIAGKLMMLR